MVSAAQELLSTARSGFRQIGYRDELLLNQYNFADYWHPDYPVREISLAGFAQQPPSYRTAGFGVLIAANGDELMSNFIALGAPKVLVINPTASEVRLWTFSGVEGPQLTERIKPEALLRTIKSRRREWGPEGVLRSKSIAPYTAPEQLDLSDFGLLPMLEQEVQRKLDSLFNRTIRITFEALKEQRGTEVLAADYRELFRLMFRLVAAKLLADRGYPGDWSNPNVEQVLQDVEGFYFRTSKPEQILDDHDVQQAAWDAIRTGFRLQNLSLEALAHVYENTLVSNETRKVYGTHATPPEIAEFVVRRLPIKDIEDPDQRTVFEPFSGHAPFLTAALGQLRSLLPSDTGVAERHSYLVEMLSGVELDSFAREIARYSLILADYPNPNGWRIAEADAFASQEFSQLLLCSNIVLCNPPFGQFTSSERQLYPNLRAANKAVETLLRVLENPPVMLGFVLPRSFTDAGIYRVARERLASLYGDVSITALPDIAFRFSEAETVVVLASARQDRAQRRYNAFVSKKDYERFVRTGRPTWEHIEEGETLPQHLSQLWMHPLAQGLKEQLKDHPTLDQVSTIHRGIEYTDPVSEHVSDRPRRGFARGLQNVENDLEPYTVSGHKYLDVEPDVMRTGAHLLPWHEPKVIANAARLSRGPWRIMAAVDYEGLTCYQRFHGIWPKGDFPVELISAVLNGPIANVLLSASETTRDNLIRDLRDIPVPYLSQEDIETVRELVGRYQNQATLYDHSYMEETALHELITQIDIIVLDGYDLPDRLKKEVMDYIGSREHPRLHLSFVDRLRERHATLIDEKFTAGLPNTGSRELDRLAHLLDAAEASYYDPIKDKLAAVRERLLTLRYDQGV